MSDFKKGDKVEMTPLAIERGLNKSTKHGTVVRAPQSGRSIYVQLEGQVSTKKYSPDFWQPAADPEANRHITKAQYLQLVGLLALAEKHMSFLEDIQRAACEITLEESGGHTSDSIFDSGRRDADQLLERLEIAVEK